MRTLSAIARDALANLATRYSDSPRPPGFYRTARPYLDAMLSLRSCADHYYADSGRTIVSYALSNLDAWRGPFASAIKRELRRHLDAHRERGQGYLSLKTSFCEPKPERSEGEGECLTSLKSGDPQP